MGDDTDEAAKEIETICVPEIFYVESGWWDLAEGFCPYVPSNKDFIAAYKLDEEMPKELLVKRQDFLWRYKANA